MHVVIYVVHDCVMLAGTDLVLNYLPMTAGANAALWIFVSFTLFTLQYEDHVINLECIFALIINRSM